MLTASQKRQITLHFVNWRLTEPYPRLSLNLAVNDIPTVRQGCRATGLKANNLRPRDCTRVAILLASKDKEVWT
jgi:hypothetical protein